jgi:hypothetical protein
LGAVGRGADQNGDFMLVEDLALGQVRGQQLKLATPGPCRPPRCPASVGAFCPGLEAI